MQCLDEHILPEFDLQVVLSHPTPSLVTSMCMRYDPCQLVFNA